jgi:hypothetical protein
MMKKFYGLLAGTEAAEVAELALVLPILFTVIFAIFSFSRAYNIYSTMTRAAQEAARVAVSPVSVSGSSVTIPASCGTATAAGQFPPDACVAQAAEDVLTASNLDPNQTSALSFSPNGTACPAPAPAQACGTVTTSNQTKIYLCRNVVINPNSGPQMCGTIVSFQYKYQVLPIPFFNVSSFTCAGQSGSICIPGRAQVRMEY